MTISFLKMSTPKAYKSPIIILPVLVHRCWKNHCKFRFHGTHNNPLLEVGWFPVRFQTDIRKTRGLFGCLLKSSSECQCLSHQLSNIINMKPKHGVFPSAGFRCSQRGQSQEEQQEGVPGLPETSTSSGRGQKTILNSPPPLSRKV